MKIPRAIATVSLFIVAVAFVLPQNVSAFTEIFPTVNSNGSVVLSTFPTSGCTGGSGYGRIIFATFPATTTVSRTDPSSNDNCQTWLANFNGSGNLNFTVDGSGYGDGNYWMGMGGNAIISQNDPYNYTYVFSLKRIGGLWAQGDPIINTTTRIDTVSPYNGQVVATTTSRTLNITGYIGEDDVGTTIEYKLVRNDFNIDTLGTLGLSQASTAIYSWTSTSTGSFNLSTSTPLLTIGNRYVYGTISKPRWSYFGINLGTNVLVSTSTMFTVATTTVYDNFIEGNASAVELLNGAFLGGDECASTANFFANFGLCLYQVFVPDKAQMVALYDTFRNEILVKAPFGYGVAMYEIFSGDTASSTLVGLNLSIPVELGLPVSGQTINFDPWGTLDTALDKLGTDVPVNGTEPILNTMLFYWNLFITLAFCWWLIQFVMSHGSHPEDRHPYDATDREAKNAVKRSVRNEKRRGTEYPFGH